MSTLGKTCWASLDSVWIILIHPNSYFVSVESEAKWAERNVWDRAHTFRSILIMFGLSTQYPNCRSWYEANKRYWVHVLRPCIAGRTSGLKKVSQPWTPVPSSLQSWAPWWQLIWNLAENCNPSDSKASRSVVRNSTKQMEVILIRRWVTDDVEQFSKLVLTSLLFDSILTLPFWSNVVLS